MPAKTLAGIILAAILSTLLGMWLWYFVGPLLQPEPPPAMTTQEAVAATALAVGSQRPAFSLADGDGVMHSVSEWDGKLLVLNFWATWCSPCLKEIPGFIKLQDRYGAQGLQFLGIALDSAENVARFSAEQEMNYPSLQGEAEAIEIGRLYGNRYGALPFTVFISPGGKVLHSHGGILDFEAAEKLIKTFLTK